MATPMKRFPFANKQRREYAPDETPLGPKSYPRVGGKPTVLDILSKRRWWFIGIGLAVILLIVFIVLIVSRAGGGSVVSKVQITVDGPDRVTLGSDVAYTVKLANGSDSQLENARVLALYPEGFSYTSSDPHADNTPGTEFSFGTLEKGDGKELLINGRLVGNVQSEQTIVVRLQFNLPGSTDILQVEASSTTKIETAGFVFDVDAPETAFPNSQVKLTAMLENNQEDPLTNLQMRVTYPGGFDFSDSDPQPDAEEHIWNIDSLGKGQQQDFTINGVLGGGAGEIKRFVFEAGVLDQNGEFLKQAEVEKAVKLTQPAVTVTQTVNNQSSDIAADGGDSLEYAVTFENTGATGISNLVLEVSFTDGAWDPTTLVVKDGGSLTQGNIISWDGTAVPELRTLGAKQRGTVEFDVRPRFEQTVDDASDKNFATTSTPTVRIGSASSAGNPITVKYRAAITPGASATIVSGANPPAVGQETTYEVTWSLTSLYAELSGARMVGSISPGATFVTGSGSVSAGEDLVYNQNTNQILWNIDRVPANVGKLTPVITAKFRVKITPQANERGLKKVMVTNQSFTAKDTWTGEDRDEAVPDVQSAKII